MGEERDHRLVLGHVRPPILRLPRLRFDDFIQHMLPCPLRHERIARRHIRPRDLEVERRLPRRFVLCPQEYKGFRPAFRAQAFLLLRLHVLDVEGAVMLE